MAQRITRDFLSEQGACSKQRTLFAELFPDGTEVTRQLCTRYAKQFDFDWAARYLLPVQAWQRYRRTRYEAWAKYHRIRNEAWAEYCRIRREAGAECQRTRSEAWAEYERIRKEAWAECPRICATEFARLWLEYMSD